MARYDVNRFGRFLSPDPLNGSATDPQSLNHYTYTENDPVNAADPSGLTMITPNPSWFLGLNGGDGDCQMDGLDTPCDMADATVASGGGVNIGSVELYLTGGIPVPGSAYDPNDPTNPNLIFGNDGTISIEAGLLVGTYSDSWQESATNDIPQAPSAPQSPANNKPGFWSCTFSAGTGTALGTTALDAIGIIPGGGNVLHGVQLAAGVGALGLSLGRASFNDVAVGGATTGLAFADAAGETTNIAIHGVEVVPVLGNFVSAVATVNDIFGKEGVISSYKACFSGGH